MKREVKDLDFFLCPTTEIDVGGVIISVLQVSQLGNLLQVPS